MAKFSEKEFEDTLKTAVDAYDRSEVARLCDVLVAHLRERLDVYPVRNAKEVLSILRKKRHLELMSKVADAFIRGGLKEPQIKRHYAQSLLDMGNVTAAMDVLEHLLEQPNIDKAEVAEIKGLLGRGYKQIYVDANDNRPAQNQDALRKAIEAYLDVYQDDDKQLWHGINAVSLLGRAYRDGIRISGVPDREAIAKDIAGKVDELRRGDKESMWDRATAAEACVALGDFQAAGEWLRAYIRSDKADAFELTSTYRQFSELIQLDKDDKEEGCLLDILRTALVKSQGGSLVTSAKDLALRAANTDQAQERLERILGTDKYVEHRWLLKAFQRARSVGRVWRKGSDQGIGTGFLLPGESLLRTWKGRKVFLTNSHVVSGTPVPEFGTLRPARAEVSFDVAEGKSGKPSRHAVVRILWESPIAELDTTVLELAGDFQETDPYPVADVLPQNADERIYVIGHPLGGELSYSIQDNCFLAISDTRIQYRSPTDPGSSGSPLFNDVWELIGIHHAGGDQMPQLDDPDKTHPANEGIPLRAIIAGIMKKPPKV